MKWICRLVLVLGLGTIISLLVVLPHVLGNKVLENDEIVMIKDLVKIPCTWEEGYHGYFCR